MEMTHSHPALRVPPADLIKTTASTAALGGIQLSELETGAVARVVAVSDRRLAELGFLPGERLRIVARGALGREPIAVRIGTGTFALRLFEAAFIRVSLEHVL